MHIQPEEAGMRFPRPRGAEVHNTHRVLPEADNRMRGTLLIRNYITFNLFVKCRPLVGLRDYCIHDVDYKEVSILAHCLLTY